MASETPLERIQDFLSQRRIAMVGVSTNPRDFSRALFREFLDRGYEMLAVNPEAEGEIDGAPAYRSVADIRPPVDGALLMTRPNVTELVVRDCAQAKVPRVWMYRAAGIGAVSEAAVRFCEAEGMSLVAGECPFMFLPRAMWLHRLHGVVRKITGSYPRQTLSHS